jgi:hypothetical protein
VNGATSAQHAQDHGRATQRRTARLGELPFLIALIVVGVLLAFAWRLLDPATAKLGDNEESRAAVDGTLALLGVVVGASCGVFVLTRPGRTPVLRTVVAILGSVIGAVVSWQLGDLLGSPSLRAVGAAFVWPLATATALLFGSLLPWTSGRLQGPAGPAHARDYYGPDVDGPPRWGSNDSPVPPRVDL